MGRVHNFSAGPAVLPVSVLEQARDAVLNLDGGGLGAMEYSHRSPKFAAVLASAKARLSRLLRLDADQEVLFLHGGARAQFFMAPMNLLRGGRATYLDTGVWSQQAAAEARGFGLVDVPFSSKSSSYSRTPRPGEWGALPEQTRYLHYTSNNTVAGTEYGYVPASDGAWLFCDASSDILSREVDGSRFDLLYAGTQKNLGPSGLTVVVVRRGLLDACDPALPTMLRYGVHVDKGSLYNTPNTWGIWLVERVCEWMEDQGGLATIEARNVRQSEAVYAAVDASAFWTGRAEIASRSRMNVTFTTGDAKLDTRCWRAAEAAGLVGLKGHSSMGGLRASLYNAQTDDAVTALVEFMKDFERTHG